VRIFLAPMEGVVDHHLRRIFAAIGGVDVCVTEFVRVNDTNLPQKVFKRSCPELVEPISIPVRVQLLGSNPEMLARCARKVAKMGAPAVDLNFGCPAKTVNRNRGGACLLDEPDLLFDIVRCVRDLVPETVPVTAKIRLGFGNREGYVDNAKAIEEAGASEIAVHGRSKQDGYRPPAYWAPISEIRQAVGIPVIANGEIWNLEDFKRCQQESGCDDFMLGRGLLARPDLALAIKSLHSGEKFCEMQWLQVIKLLWGFHLATVPNYPKKYCGNRMKQWLMYLSKHYPQAKRFFEVVKREKRQEVIQQLFDQHLEEEKAGT